MVQFENPARRISLPQVADLKTLASLIAGHEEATANCAIEAVLEEGRIRDYRPAFVAFNLLNEFLDDDFVAYLDWKCADQIEWQANAMLRRHGLPCDFEWSPPQDVNDWTGEEMENGWLAFQSHLERKHGYDVILPDSEDDAVFAVLVHRSHSTEVIDLFARLGIDAHIPGNETSEPVCLPNPRSFALIARFLEFGAPAGRKVSCYGTRDGKADFVYVTLWDDRLDVSLERVFIGLASFAFDYTLELVEGDFVQITRRMTHCEGRNKSIRHRLGERYGKDMLGVATTNLDDNDLEWLGVALEALQKNISA